MTELGVTAEFDRIRALASCPAKGSVLQWDPRRRFHRLTPAWGHSSKSSAKLKLWRPIACLGVLVAGCAPATAPPTRTPLPAYADGKGYLVPTNLGMVSRAQAATTGVTRYFQIDSRRICYSFQVSGTWEAEREAGAIRRLDGKGVVGVLLLSVPELGGGSVENAIRKAAERSDELYAKERRGAPSILTRYPAVPHVWQWTVPAEVTVGERQGVRIIPRWYVPVGEAWIAQFTIGAPPEVDHDTFVADVLMSLTTSREPRCYEARLRELGGAR